MRRLPNRCCLCHSAESDDERHCVLRLKRVCRVLSCTHRSGQGFQVTITDLGGICIEGITSVRLGVLPAGTYAVAVRVDTRSDPFRHDSFVVTWAAPIPLFNGPTGLALLFTLAVLGTLLLRTGRQLAS